MKLRHIAAATHTPHGLKNISLDGNAGSVGSAGRYPDKSTIDEAGHLSALHALCASSSRLCFFGGEDVSLEMQ
jgi:hypothetical protein